MAGGGSNPLSSYFPQKHFCLTSTFTEEQALVAAFVRFRVFPMIDEFTVAHRIASSTDAMLFMLLAQRLAHTGYKPSDIGTMALDSAMTFAEANRAKAPGSPPPSNVVEFSATG
jgi:hypothetical protein